MFIVFKLCGSVDRNCHFTGARAAMADQGARAAMADPGAWAAMADPGARAVMADRGIPEALAGPPPRPRPQPPPPPRPRPLTLKPYYWLALEGAVEEPALEVAVEERALEGAFEERALTWREPRPAGLPYELPAGVSDGATNSGGDFPADGGLGGAANGGELERAADGGMLESAAADRLDWGWADGLDGRLVLARARTFPRHRKIPSPCPSLQEVLHKRIYSI